MSRLALFCGWAGLFMPACGRQGEGGAVVDEEYEKLMGHGDTATSTPDDTAEIVEVEYGHGE